MIKNLVKKSTWLIDFSCLKLASHSLNLMFCFDIETKNIKAWAIGFKPLTIQNVVRKVEEAIAKYCFQDPSTQLTIHTEAENYNRSMTYKKFRQNYCHWFLEVDEINSQKLLHDFQKDFFASQINEVTFSQALMNYLKDIAGGQMPKSVRLIVKKYVANWNEREDRVSEREQFISMVDQVEKKHAELVYSTPFELTYEEKGTLYEVKSQLEKLTNVIKQENTSLGDLVAQQTQQLTKKIEKVEERVIEVCDDVKKLLPTEKQKHVPRPLRDPISEEMFQLFLLNAGSKASYKKRIRQSQLRIAYTLLYYLGLRLNELRTIRLEEIQEAIHRSELRVTLFKTNMSHNYTFSTGALKRLNDLQVDFDFLAKEQKYIYLFGKKAPPHSKTLLRIVNQDLTATCKLCNILENFTSHSFRIGHISRLLCVTSVQNAAAIIGHLDIRSTMKYKRYQLRKAAIQKIYEEAEQVNKNSIS